MKSAAYCCLILLSVMGMSSGIDVAEEVKKSEHCRAHELFLESDADWVAVASGAWSEAATWGKSGTLRAGARVLVPEGQTVTIDADLSNLPLEWIRVDGELEFGHDRDTGIKVGSLFVSESGVLQIGLADERIGEGFTAEVIFAERKTREALRDGDPSDLSGGLISFGRVQVFGAEKTGFGLVSNGIAQGATSAEFDTPVVGWRAGDQLIIPRTDVGTVEDELRTLKEISADGRTISWDGALAFGRSQPNGVRLPIGNLTRNVRFESEVDASDSSIHKRGHIMLMHAQTGTRIEGAGFHRLGRTRSDQIHTRPMIDADGKVAPGSDTNPIGRYALHFHGRTGASISSLPQMVRGCVITDSPKHGLVNHGGHVLAEGNVTYQIRGSHFFGENGSEVGAFVGNLAIRSGGTGEDLKSRMYSADMGHTGHGFWLQGGGIELRENYAFGHRDAAYIFHMKPHMVEGGLPVRFAAENLRDPEVASGQADVDPANVPIYFSGNVAAGCGSGLTVRYHKRQAKHSVASVFERSVFWNTSMNRQAIDLDYSKGITLRDVEVLAEKHRPNSVGILTNGESGSFVCENVTVAGFAVGITVPRRGTNAISGGRLDNRRNIIIQEAVAPGREVAIRGVEFVEPRSSWEDPFDIVMLGRGDWLGSKRRFPSRWHADELANLPMQFERDVVHLDQQRIYFNQQAHDARPLAGLVEGELGQLSGEQLSDEHGLAVAGEVAPIDSMRTRKIFGLVGPPQINPRKTPAALQLVSPRRSNKTTHYVPIIKALDGTELPCPPTQLDEGWNLIPLDSEAHSALVYGDTRDPRLELKNRDWKIHPSDLDYGFLVAGRLHDQLGAIATDRKFNYFAKVLPEPVDGVIHLDVPASDLAGNEIVKRVEIRVTEEAVPRQSNVDQSLAD